MKNQSAVWISALLMASSTSVVAQSSNKAEGDLYHSINFSASAISNDNYDRGSSSLGWEGKFRFDDVYIGPFVSRSATVWDGDFEDVVDSWTTLGGSLIYAPQSNIPAIGISYYIKDGEYTVTPVFSAEFSRSWERNSLAVGLRHDFNDQFSAGINRLSYSHKVENFNSVDRDVNYLNAGFYPSQNARIALTKAFGDREHTGISFKYKFEMFAIGIGHTSYSDDRSDDSATTLYLQWKLGARKGASIQTDDRTSFL